MFKIQQLNHAPDEPQSEPRAPVIDAEVVTEEGSPLQLRVASPEESPPTLFALPPELDPQVLLASQRSRLDQMMASLEGRDSGASESGPPPPSPELETPEAFLHRAMALLDGHLEAMEGTLERIVGRRWTRNEDS